MIKIAEPPRHAELEDLRREVVEYKKTVAELASEIAALYPGQKFVARNIAVAVAKIHGVRFVDLISNRRHKHLCHARQHAMWEIRRRTKLSLPQIGQLLGGRDHTTVLHGLKQHERRLRGEIV
jgi:chromosomal replication initiator protein